MQKNVILTDFLPSSDWEFLQGILESTGMKWEVLSCTSNQLRTNIWIKLLRYIRYFSFPWRLFLRRKTFCKVVAWQQFYGLNLAFFERLFRVEKTNDLTVMTFIYKRKQGIIGTLYFNFIKYCITSKYIDRLVVFTVHEVDYYSKLFQVEESKFRCMNLGISDVSGEYEVSDNGRLLSAGRSNRDYDFLIASLKDTEISLDIICDTIDYESNGKIQIYKNIEGKAYYKMLAQCHAVIVPIKDENISSGQLVILQSMMMGKPIITTKSCSSDAYLQHGETALIISNVKWQLLESINMLYEDTELYISMQKNAKEEYRKNYSLLQLGRSVGLIIIGQDKII